VIFKIGGKGVECPSLLARQPRGLIEEVENMKQEHDQDQPVSPDRSSETRIRQGITGQGVRYVLAFSILGVVTAFVVLAFVF
jgi:hypothetical protein